MKNLLNVFVLALAIMLQACTCSDESKLPLFDFGTGKYKQPFRGLLKSEPEVLVRSLQYVPFKWFAPDTVILNKSFGVSFNEESIRSKSIATISFSDSLGRAIEGLSFVYNGFPVNENTVTVVADSLYKRFNLSIIIHPNFGERDKVGFVYVSGIELDQVNGVSLQQEANIVASWKCSQTYGWPIGLWILWFITSVLLIAALIVILYYLFKFLLLVTKSVCDLAGKSFSSISDIERGKYRNFYNEDNDEKRNKEDDRKPQLKYGYWNGDDNFIINPDYIIPNGNQHKNPYGKTCMELAQDLGDTRLETRFKDGYPVFDKDGGTKDGKPLSVEIPEGIDKYLDKGQILKSGKKNREKLHVEAFTRIANKYGLDYDELQVFKGNSEPIERLCKKWNCSEDDVWKKCRNPNRIMRVLHECEDCKTIQLVPWLYHHVPHSGGIEKITNHF